MPPRAPALAARPPCRSLWSRLLAWHRMGSERSDLARLDAAMLRDIGLTPDQVRRETARPFWDVPHRRL